MELDEILHQFQAQLVISKVENIDADEIYKGIKSKWHGTEKETVCFMLLCFANNTKIKVGRLGNVTSCPPIQWLLRRAQEAKKRGTKMKIADQSQIDDFTDDELTVYSLYQLEKGTGHLSLGVRQALSMRWQRWGKPSVPKPVPSEPKEKFLVSTSNASLLLDFLKILLEEPGFTTSRSTGSLQKHLNEFIKIIEKRAANKSLCWKDKTRRT